ncbi:DICT sensory domain-containing protein [Williamsia soli]|uniref:DICT sensory domain-containing protein n=1 Tax=Williamsia soli TaxID=364929 RepID=UPI001A9FC3F9|nr:DICT sensory domain-containing protein [Williamsia soli]
MQFAPVRRLADGALAAVELQVRGVAGSALSSADALRRATRLMEQKTALDQQKIVFADSAAARHISEILPVLIAIDLTSVPADALKALTPASALQRLVLSVSPAQLLARPHDMLAAIRAARGQGRMICVDGLGVEPQAIAMLALIEPDIIITGPELLARTGDPDMAELAHALAAHVERTHAVVVAEGVDDDHRRLAAHTIGATYGTGALYPSVSNPADLPIDSLVPLPQAPVWSTPAAGRTTPYKLAAAAGQPRRGTKRLLVQMSKSLEAQATAAGQAMIVVGTFQHARHFTTHTAQRWHDLATVTGFAGVYGVGLTPMSDGNVHHAPLHPDDDLVNEWTIAVLGPHFCALLAARDLHDNGPDLERTFDFIQSFDRLTVTQAIHTILTRFTHTR